MKRVYIAGSYNAPDIITCLDNMRRGIQMAVQILKAGYSPFCCWLDYHYRLMDSKITREMYQAQSMAWLEASDAVLVMPNSEDSKGTQAEIARARELGIPVYHSFEQLQREIPTVERLPKYKFTKPSRTRFSIHGYYAGGGGGDGGMCRKEFDTIGKL